MGRESSDALEQAALSFLSGIDTDLGLDAALFVRRTGLVLASWMREGIRLDVVSVMAATMLASVDTIIESVGGRTPDVISVDTDTHQIVATKVNSRAFLVVIAPKKVSRTVVRKTMRGLNARLAAAASKSTHPRAEGTEEPTVNVRPRWSRRQAGHERSSPILHHGRRGRGEPSVRSALGIPRRPPANLRCAAPRREGSARDDRQGLGHQSATRVVSSRGP